MTSSTLLYYTNVIGRERIAGLSSNFVSLILKFCHVFSSKSNKLWIRFYSDSAITGQGFAVNYAISSSSSFAGFTRPPQAEFSGNLFIFNFQRESQDI